MRAELLKGNLDLLLLSVLADSPLHGYAVIEELRAARRVRAARRHVYPALHRLEAADLVGEPLVVRVGPPPPRVLAHPQGPARPRARREEWHAFSGAVGAVIA